MQVNLPFGDGVVTVECDVDHRVLTPTRSAAPEPRTVIDEALSDPMGGDTFDSFAAGTKRLLVIVSDATRATPTALVLENLRPELERHPDVRFLVACGTHRAPTEEELERIFGDMLPTARDSLVVHVARSDQDLIDLGTTPTGTPVRFNRLVGDCDGILTIGAVKPHYFAGYSGGRKSFLPGVAHYDTIQANHSGALSEKAEPMGLKGNPVAEDMADAVTLLPHQNIWSVQLVLSPEKVPVSAHAGIMETAFAAAVKDAARLFCVPLERRGNIVVSANPPPMDVNLYQSQHAIENARLALEPPGVIVLVSACPEGVGDDDLLEQFDILRERGDGATFTRDEYRLGMHKAARVMAMKRYAKIMAVTGLPPDVTERAGMEPRASVQDALDAAVEHIRLSGAEPRTIFLPSGGSTVPRISRNNAE